MDDNARALHVLARYPRRASGSPQNLFRSHLYSDLRRLYSRDRANSTEPNDQTDEEAVRIAIESMRRGIPDSEWLPLKQVSATFEIPYETLEAVRAEFRMEIVEAVVLNEVGQEAEHRLEDAHFQVQWLRPSENGAWMVNVLNASGECIDTALADDPQEAILAVADRLLP